MFTRTSVLGCFSRPVPTDFESKGKWTILLPKNNEIIFVKKTKSAKTPLNKGQNKNGKIPNPPLKLCRYTIILFLF